MNAFTELVRGSLSDMSTPRAEVKQLTHSRVVDAAARLFVEEGFAGTSIRGIAKAAGVSVGTVMSVGDKSALLVRVFDLLVEAEVAERTALISRARATVAGHPDARFPLAPEGDPGETQTLSLQDVVTLPTGSLPISVRCTEMPGEDVRVSPPTITAVRVR